MRLDIETGGENCGIIQLSAQIIRLVQHNSKLTSDTERECFDEYVRPSNDAIWDFKYMFCIGITIALKKQMISLKYGADFSLMLVNTLGILRRGS